MIRSFKFKEDNMNPYKRPQEAARYLSIGLSTFWLYVKQNKITVTKLSARVTVVSQEELDKFIAKCRTDAK